MNGANIHVISNDTRDWVVKEEGTDPELGHYPTQADAEAVGLALARKRKSEVVITAGTGKRTCARFVAVGSAACLDE